MQALVVTNSIPPSEMQAINDLEKTSVHRRSLTVLPPLLAACHVQNGNAALEIHKVDFHQSRMDPQGKASGPKASSMWMTGWRAGPRCRLGG